MCIIKSEVTPTKKLG